MCVCWRHVYLYNEYAFIIVNRCPIPQLLEHPGAEECCEKSCKIHECSEGWLTNSSLDLYHFVSVNSQPFIWDVDDPQLDGRLTLDFSGVFLFSPEEGTISSQKAAESA